jgi:hypothetical protein
MLINLFRSKNQEPENIEKGFITYIFYGVEEDWPKRQEITAIDRCDAKHLVRLLYPEARFWDDPPG